MTSLFIESSYNRRNPAVRTWRIQRANIYYWRNAPYILRRTGSGCWDVAIMCVLRFFRSRPLPVHRYPFKFSCRLGGILRLICLRDCFISSFCLKLLPLPRVSSPHLSRRPHVVITHGNQNFHCLSSTFQFLTRRHRFQLPAFPQQSI